MQFCPLQLYLLNLLYIFDNWENYKQYTLLHDPYWESAENKLRNDNRA